MKVEDGLAACADAHAEPAHIPPLRVLHALFDASEDLVLSLKPDGTITYASPRAAEALSRPAAELLGESLAYYVPRAQWVKLKRALGRVAREASSVRLRHQFGAEPASLLHVESRISLQRHPSGALECCLVARDASQTRRVEDELKFKQFALDRTPDAAYLIEEDASVVYANDAACRMLGYSREEHRSLRIHDLNPDVSAEGWRKNWGLLRRLGQRTFEARHRAKDGRLVPVEISANLVQLDGKAYSLAFCRDITDRKELEHRLREAEKMEAVGALAGGIAHDFNNQLTGILGNAEVLAEEIKDHPGALELVDAILASATQAADLTKQLLAFSRQGKYVSEPVDLHRLLEEVVETLSATGEAPVTIEQHLEARNATVIGDASQLQSALLNLALNAMESMPAGGTLRLRSSNTTLSDDFRAAHEFRVMPTEYLRLEVQDSGAGMAQETQRRIFEPFFTTKQPGKGTGLGLAAVYGTLKNHHGAIQVQSAPGQGTTMHVYLPSAVGLTPAARPPTGLAAIPENAHVAVIEDEPTVRDVVTRLLQALGCRVTAFGGGAEALTYYQRIDGERIDLVLLDMVMPDMSGPETFRALRRMNPDVRVILASGYSLDRDARQLLEEGALGFIQKPYGRAALAAKVAEALVPSCP